MLNQFATPEIIVLAGGLACLLAVVALVLAGRSAFVRGMATKLAAIETQITQRQRLLDDVGQKMAEAAELQKKVDHLDKRSAALQQEIQPLEGKHLKALSDYEDAKAKLRETREEWSQIRERVDVYKDRVAKIAELEKEIMELESKKAGLEDIVKNLPERQKELAQVERMLLERTKETEEQQKVLKKMATEKEVLGQQVMSAQKAVKECDAELQKRRDEINKLENAKIDLDARLETLSDKLKSVGQMPPEAFDSLRQSVFEVATNTRPQALEETALQGLYHLVEASGFEIPRRLQDAFHTALKTSDISCLTVMAGVSGTGKSAFPKLYAQAMGMHFLPLAVEPRWDSPHDLFGFLNYMENRFEATTLGRALVQFNNSSHAPGELNGQLLMVLLDEMNLARIEYYFSEFLSKLEMRRNSNVSREEDYRIVSVEVFPGYAGDDEKDPSPAIRLYAGSNVLFVGTMNEDETTQSLSDKVIDRANVLYFGKPNRLQDHPQRNMPDQGWLPLSENSWRQWAVIPSANTITAYGQVDSLINNINGTLALLGRPFGWRTYKAIQSYVANHPDVRLRGNNGLRALADQLAMRVMPKLRGLDLAEHGEVFTRLGQLIQQVADEPLRQAFDRARQSTHGFFDWRGMNWEE